MQLSEKAIANAEKSGEAVKLPVEVKAGKNIKAASTVTINLPEGARENESEDSGKKYDRRYSRSACQCRWH